jgi:hypothetical protein
MNTIKLYDYDWLNYNMIQMVLYSVSESHLN